MAILSAVSVALLPSGAAWLSRLAERRAGVPAPLPALALPAAGGSAAGIAPREASPTGVDAAAADGPWLHAAIVLHPADCSGNLRSLALFSPAALGSRLRVERIWIVGAAGDSGVVRSALPAYLQKTPLATLAAGRARALRDHGYDRTPLFIVVDATGRLRLIAPVPTTPRAYLGLRKTLDYLTWTAEP